MRLRQDQRAGEAGSKYHVLVDRHGVPLVLALTAASVHDSGSWGALTVRLCLVSATAVRQRITPQRSPAPRSPVDHGSVLPCLSSAAAVHVTRLPGHEHTMR